MKTKLLLWVASGLMVFHALGHTMGMSGWDKAANPEQAAVIGSMKDHRFPFMGAVHSFADSFDGFGFAATVNMLLIAGLLWLAASCSDKQPAISTKMLVFLFVSLVVLCILEFIYFFPLAAINTLLAGLLTGAAIVSIVKRKVPASI